MKLITLQLELYVPDLDAEDLADYLNTKLYEDPEFFGVIDAENIVSVKQEID